MDTNNSSHCTSSPLLCLSIHANPTRTTASIYALPLHLTPTPSSLLYPLYPVPPLLLSTPLSFNYNLSAPPPYSPSSHCTLCPPPPPHTRSSLLLSHPNIVPTLYSYLHPIMFPPTQYTPHSSSAHILSLSHLYCTVSCSSIIKNS